MSRIFELLRQAEQERRAVESEMPPAAVDRGQTHAAAASVADLDETKEMPRMAPQVSLSANGSAPRQVVSCGVDNDEGPRAGAAPASTEALPDLQAFLATAYLLGKNRQPLSTELAPEGSARLFSSLVSLQQQAADLELEMDEVLASVAHHARALTRADGAAVALLQDNGVVCRGRAGLKAPTLGTFVNLRSSFTGQSFCTREVLYCEDTKDDPRVNETACSVAGIRSILVVPVEQNQQSIGIVEVFSASPARFGTSERRALELLADLVADAIRVRDVVGPPPPREPVAAACEVVPPLATTSMTAKPALTPAPREIRRDVAVPSELARSEQELVVVRRPRSRSLFRLWLVISTLSLSCITGVFVAYQRGFLRPPALAPRSVVAAEPAPTITVTASPLPQTVAIGPAILQGVKYNSQPDFTSIAIELSGPVKVNAEQLPNSERIYFDLDETRIAPEVIDALHTKIIPVGDRLVNRLRVAQKSKDVARVVIDLNRACKYTYLMSEAPPFRLLVELHATDKAAGAERRASATTAPAVALPAIAPKRTRIAAPIRPLKEKEAQYAHLHPEKFLGRLPEDRVPKNDPGTAGVPLCPVAQSSCGPSN